MCVAFPCSIIQELMRVSSLPYLFTRIHPIVLVVGQHSRIMASDFVTVTFSHAFFLSSLTVRQLSSQLSHVMASDFVTLACSSLHPSHPSCSQPVTEPAVPCHGQRLCDSRIILTCILSLSLFSQSANCQASSPVSAQQLHDSPS